MRPRAIHYISAVLVGLGLGVCIYRFAILGFFYAGPTRWIFPALGAGLTAAGFKLQSTDTQSERPRVSTRLSLALVAIAAAIGMMHFVVPTLARARLERRELPGFSFELPTANADVEQIDYNAGTLTWKQVGGANAVVSVSWQVGTVSKEDLEVGMRALAGSMGVGPARSITMTGPAGVAVETMMVDTDKDAPLRLSMMPCGNRQLLVMTIGVSGIESVHARILESMRCSPDATKDTQPGIIRVALSLPGWTTQDREPGQLTLTNGKAVIILRETNAGEAKLEETIVPMLNAMGGKVEAMPAVGDRVPFVGTIEGEKIEGWARRVACPTHEVLLLAMATNSADAEDTYVASSNAGCLREGEAPPTWPDVAPAAQVAP